MATGPLGLCLRVHEPSTEEDEPSPESWSVEVLVSDESDQGLRIPLAVAGQRRHLRPDAGQALLADLARSTRVAPELAGLLDEAIPARIAVDAQQWRSCSRPGSNR